MDVSRITEAEVKQVLECMRRAKPMTGSALLRMGVLGQRLRESGSTSTPESLEWALSSMLSELVCANLARLRGTEAPIAPAALPVGIQLDPLREDFAADSLEREAWSSLYYRYVFQQGMQVNAIAAAARPDQKYGNRHIRRRIRRGVRLLSGQLRDLEREKTQDERSRHNIPHIPTRYIGREAEQGAIRSLLAGHRLVTLIGVAGVGKSRLALELGSALSRDYRDGVWLVELATVDDPASVVPALASALRVRRSSGTSILDDVLGSLRGRSLLLVLDNCEHLQPACSDLAANILKRCAEVQIIATSRERLRAEGESVWPVPPLEPPEDDWAPVGSLLHNDAVRLFVDRARAALPGFELSDENGPAVAEICRSLDGIPLAIELAAGRLSVLAPSELADRMPDRFRLLTDGRRPSRPHHETLQAAMDWSYDLLSDGEKALYRRLSAFRGGWTLGAAKSVCGFGVVADGAVLDLLSHLCDKSLVLSRSHAQQRRFHMLSTVRQHAAQKLQGSADDGRTLRQHLAYFVRLAEDAESAISRDPACLRGQTDLLATEYANFNAALKCAVHNDCAEAGLRLGDALSWYWYGEGRWEEGQRQLERLLSLPNAIESRRPRALAMSSRAWLLLRLGEIVEARRLAEEALAEGRDLEDRYVVMQGLRSLSQIALYGGRYEEARAVALEVQAIGRDLGDARRVAGAGITLGLVAKNLGCFDEARQHYSDALATFRELGDDANTAGVLVNLGNVDQRIGNVDAARARFEESLGLYRGLGDSRGRSTCLHNLANMAVDRGDLDSAQQLCDEAYAIRLHLRDLKGQSESLEQLGFVAGHRGDNATAVEFYERSLTVARQMGNPLRIAWVLIPTAQCLREMDDATRARKYLEESHEISREFHNSPVAAECCCELGNLETDEGHLETARELLAEGLAIYRRIGVRIGVADSLRSFSGLALQSGDEKRAVRLFSAAETEFELLGNIRTPRLRSDDARFFAHARVVAGDAFEVTRGEGRTLTVDEAVAYALGEVTWDELAPVVAERLEAGDGAAEEAPVNV